VHREEETGELLEVHILPVQGQESYAIALHELGHIFGRYQRSARVIVRERWAWRWARENALMWTPAMERCANAGAFPGRGLANVANPLASERKALCQEGRR
jgi:antirestriction protein ArdC